MDGLLLNLMIWVDSPTKYYFHTHCANSTVGHLRDTNLKIHYLYILNINFHIMTYENLGKCETRTCESKCIWHEVKENTRLYIQLIIKISACMLII